MKDESHETTSEEAREHTPGFLMKAARKAKGRGKRKHHRKGRRK